MNEGLTLTLYWLGLVAVFVFSVSGALAAAERKLDILGFVLFAAVTGVGGGTLRDLIINTDVFWVKDPVWLHVCVLAAVVTYFAPSKLKSRQSILLWMDAVGLALFSVLGTAKALALGIDPLISVAMGMITPTFGSIMRDIILDREPVLLGPEIYVTAALVGGIVYLALEAVLHNETIAILIAIQLSFAVRAAAMIWDLRLPKFASKLRNTED